MNFEGDIVDFGPSGAESRRRLSLPKIPGGVPLGLAVAGGVLAAISLFAPWQKLASGRLPFTINGEYVITLEQTGLEGWALLIGFMALFSLGAVALFGVTRQRRVAALAGTGLSVAMLLLLAMLANRLGKSSPYFSPFNTEASTAKYAVGWGLYAAGASTVLFGLSMLTVLQVRVRRPIEPLPEPEGIELEVRVESI